MCQNLVIIVCTTALLLHWTLSEDVDNALETLQTLYDATEAALSAPDVADWLRDVAGTDVGPIKTKLDELRGEVRNTIYRCAKDNFAKENLEEVRERLQHCVGPRPVSSKRTFFNPETWLPSSTSGASSKIMSSTVVSIQNGEFPVNLYCVA